MDDEEDDEEGDEQGDETEDDGRSGTDRIFDDFNGQFRWIHTAVKVREVTGYDIDKVFDMNVCEFFNYAIYIKSWANVQYAIQKMANNKLKLRK